MDMELSFLLLMSWMKNKNVNVTIRQRIIENSIFDCFTFMTIHSKPVSFLYFENDMKCFENAKVDFTDDI